MSSHKPKTSSSTPAQIRALPIIGAQIRAARGLLGWTQADLAAKSMVSKATIDAFERGVREPNQRTMRDLTLTFFSKGLRFIGPEMDGEGCGVRFVSAHIQREWEPEDILKYEHLEREKVEKRIEKYRFEEQIEKERLEKK